MTIDKRRAKRISVDLPVAVYFYNTAEKTRLGTPLAGSIRDLSPLGVALSVATILHDGKHLFYTCNDDPGIILEVAFEFSVSPEIIIALPAAPVWFDRDLESEDKQFNLGLEFLVDSRSPEIKTLCRRVCQNETTLISLWKKFF